MSLMTPAPEVPNAAKAARRVLVVDDSRAQRVLLSRTLARWGFSVIEAETGEAALDICRDAEIELVISDWMMPGMSGVEFCRAFRELKAGRPAYFVLLTAQTDRETLAEGLDSGADDFLSKPFHVVELRARLTAGERVLTAQRDVLNKNALLSGALDELQVLYSALDRDLREARAFQQALVPERHQALPGAEVSLLYLPSGHVGGDLVGLFRISDSRYGVYSVDVAGHGIASALMTARIAAHLSASSPDRNVALTADQSGTLRMLAPDEVCRRLNRVILDDIETDVYFTMIIAEIDLETGHVAMGHAGHPSPAILRADGSAEFAAAFGMPIGLIPDAQFATSEAVLAPGDRLVLYSDGLTECPMPDGSLLDEAGLATLFTANTGLTGVAFLDGIVASLTERSGLGTFPDDLSGLMVERTKTP